MDDKITWFSIILWIAGLVFLTMVSTWAYNEPCVDSYNRGYLVAGTLALLLAGLLLLYNMKR